MADKRFKVGNVGGTGVAAIWEGAGDTLPFTDPDAHADRVLFTTKWDYTRIIDKRTVNCTFPKASSGGERQGTVTLFAHGISGYPRVRGNITIGGHKLSLGCHVPVQYRNVTSGYYEPLAFRLAIIGATSTNVVVCWYANLLGLSSADFPSITIPITVEVTNEINV
jgi:hypothetical protein